MSRIEIIKKPTPKKVFVASSKIVSIRGVNVDLFKARDTHLKELLETPFLSNKEKNTLLEELDRRNELRESAWSMM